MKNILSALRILGFTFFLASLVLSYSYMPDQVEAFSTEEGVQTISRADFFYLSIGLFMLINIMFTAFAALTDKAPFRTGGFFKSAEQKQAFSTWVKIENMLINVLMAACIIFLGIFNNPESLSPSGFVWLVYISIGLLALWTLQLIRVLFLYKKD